MIETSKHLDTLIISTTLLSFVLLLSWFFMCIFTCCYLSQKRKHSSSGELKQVIESDNKNVVLAIRHNESYGIVAATPPAPICEEVEIQNHERYI